MSAEATATIQPYIPLISAISGGVVGGVVTVFGQIFVHKYKERERKKLESVQKKMLDKMLRDPTYEWRSLSTLRGTVGADLETAKRLLIDIGARGRMGNPKQWALMELKPLPKDGDNE
ncbi:hypothetical protein [uncultured Roseobacter sp.]|uniref:hypothetical protein n=1 Tax=uncultured Roseobacter sp. TaxID=114847 RepID=UPI0026117A4D|nr:hypothetical protein [uncultured Roseobacter sp.]